MPVAQIYISRGGEQFGPFSAEDIGRLIENGHFSWEDLAWREGFEEWSPLHLVFPAAGAEASLRARQVSAEAGEEPAPFFHELLRAFIYPFRGAGAWAILLFGTILITVMSVAGIVPVVGFILTVLITGYYIAFLFKIIRETAVGEQEVAEFPGLQDIWDDVLRPLAQMFFAILFCILPFVLATGFVEEGPEELSWLPLALLGAGLFYLPMVLLATVIFNSLFTALNPFLSVPAISRIFLRYLVVVLLLGATVIGHELLGDLLAERMHSLAALPVVSFISFYLGIIQARILGLIYRTSKDRIGWFNR